MESILRAVIASTLLAGLSVSPTLLADEQTMLEGCYVPVRGFAESASYSESEQLGQYRVVLLRKGSSRRNGCGHHRTTCRLVIEGPFRGILVVDQVDVVLNHVLGNVARKGFIYTANDTFAIESQVPCEGGGGLVLEGTETINPIAGTGRFAGLLAGGRLVVAGTINTCTGLNDFDLVPGEGELCFEVEE